MKHRTFIKSLSNAGNPDETPKAIEAQTEWTMISGQELEQRKLGSWYMTTDHDLSNTECVFVVHDAERSVG